jgi:diguanylate cyclase (GGDEF)-like protein
MQQDNSDFIGPIDPVAARTRFNPLVGRGPIRWLILCGITLVLSIALGTAFAVGSFRQRALEAHQHEQENTLLLLARHFDQQLADFILVQQGVANDLQRLGIAAPDVFKDKMSTRDVHETLRSKVKGSSDVAGLNVYDSDGILVNSSEAWPVPAIDIADRRYFKDLKANPASATLAEVVRNRLVDKWALMFATRLAGANGEFMGLVTRGIDSEVFEDFFRSMAITPGDSIGLYHADGTLLARYPHAEAWTGRNFKASPVHQQVLARSDHGTIQLKSPIDGFDRLASARRLSKFPITIIATTTVAAALADWREQTKLLIAISALAALVIAVILTLIVGQLARQYRASRHRLDTALNNMTQGLMLYDASSRIVLFNRRYIEMYGLSLDIIKPGRLFRDVMKHRRETGSFQGDDEEFCTRVLRNVAEKKLTHTILETSSGRSFQIVNQPLADGGWVATHEDITELRRSEERIMHLAHYDALTDLPNRVLFREQLDQEIKKAKRGEKFALLYIDVDEFKGINDSLGHPVGDEFLKQLAQRLQSCIREVDFVARLGGDEFAIIQTAVEDVTEITNLVVRLHEAIRQPYDCLGHRVMTDASIGVAIAPADGSDIDQLIMNADLAMYDAKAAGRRTYRFFEWQMDSKAKARRLLELDLREALRTSSFELHYQPLVDLATNQVVCFEALLRWRHPERGAISPADFIPVAEDTGLINQIGDWVLTTACAEAVKWPSGIKLAVNVSPVQFKSGTWALKVAAALAASGLSSKRLELEITEAVLISDDEAALAVLHHLREIGVSIALDDFGTGYSSLSYLQRFPFDKIKIDRSFIRDIDQLDGSSPIIQAVVDIARSRHMTTTAEGVETQEQLTALRAFGCNQMQGYLFSAAVPASEVGRLLSAGRLAEQEASRLTNSAAQARDRA